MMVAPDRHNSYYRIFRAPCREASWPRLSASCAGGRSCPGARKWSAGDPLGKAFGTLPALLSPWASLDVGYKKGYLASCCDNSSLLGPSQGWGLLTLSTI